MNLHHLRLFHAVATHGSFTRAAEALYVSQPAVSRQVRELERELDVALLDQVGRTVRLTEAGRLLNAYADRIFALEAEVEQALADRKGLRSGSLRIGASMTAGVYVLPELLGRFKAAHPGIRLWLDIANTREVERGLLENRLDLAVVEGSVTAPEILHEPFRDDELVVVAPPAHPLAQREVVRPGDLEAFDFLVRERGSGTREVSERAFAAAGIHPPAAMELGSIEAIKRGVAAGLGLAALSRRAVADEVQTGQLSIVHVVGLDLSRGLEIVRHRDKRLSRAAEAFLQLLRS